MRAFRFSLLLALPLVFAACDSLNPDAEDVRRGFIERVVVTELPSTQPDGGAWDSGNNPDVYFRLLGVNDSPDLINGEEDGVVALGDDSPDDGIFGGVDVEGSDNDLPLDYRLDNPLVAQSEIDVLDRTLRLEVKDDDSPLGTDQRMGISEPFTLLDQLPSTLPSDRTVTFTVNSDDGTMEARITVRYER